MLSIGVLSTLCFAGEPPVENGMSAAKRARLKAVARQRRVIFNTDTADLAYPQGGTVEGFLPIRLEPLVGTQVDAVVWSVLGVCGDAPVYDSKVQPIFGDAHGAAQPAFPEYVPNIKRLVEAGDCPLRVVTDFAHRNGIEAWAGLRMNDCHDSFIAGMQTKWKQSHPELLVDGTGISRSRREHQMALYHTAQDFSHREVRDRKFEIIEEIAERYDIDAFQFNFIRHPVFFGRTMRGLPVRREELEIMTSLMRRIRRCTDDAAARRGRPILLAAIVPDNLQSGVDLGLDVRTWVKEDLVDILIPGLGYAPFSMPVAEFTELAGPYGVPVFPCINRVVPWTGGAETDGLLIEGFRAVATNWYRAGADGVFFWNLASPFERLRGRKLIDTRRTYYACLAEIGEAKTLVGKDKLFCVDNPVHSPFGLDVGPYHHVSSTPPLPVTLTLERPQSVPLLVGDHLAAAGESGTIAKLQLELHLTGPVDKDSLVMQINGKGLTGGELATSDAENSEFELTYTPDPSLFRLGENILTASLGKATHEGPPVVLRGLKLLVRYESGEGR